MLLRRGLEDALLAVLALLEVRAVLQRPAGGEGLPRGFVERVDDGAWRGGGWGVGGAAFGPLLLRCTSETKDTLERSTTKT